MERDQQINIRLTKKELEAIREHMGAAGFISMSEYIRKMALNGFVIKVDLSAIREISSLLRYNGNNINQIAKRLNMGRSVYREEIKDIQEQHMKICEMLNSINTKLSKL